MLHSPRTQRLYHHGLRSETQIKGEVWVLEKLPERCRRLGMDERCQNTSRVQVPESTEGLGSQATRREMGPHSFNTRSSFLHSFQNLLTLLTEKYFHSEFSSKILVSSFIPSLGAVGVPWVLPDVYLWPGLRLPLVAIVTCLEI